MPVFPVKLQLRLDWSEMDLFGHINNVSYFKYIQSSRVHYWEVSGLAVDFETTRQGPILLSASCQFIKPLTYPGLITIASRVEFIKNTSFGIHHCICNEAGELCAEAHDVIVFFNFNTNEKTPIPDSFRESVRLMQQEDI